MTNYQRRERRRMRRANVREFTDNTFRWFYDDIFLAPFTNDSAYYHGMRATPTLHLAALVKAGKRIRILAEQAQRELDRRHKEAQEHKFLEMMGCFTYVEVPIPVHMLEYKQHQYTDIGSILRQNEQTVEIHRWKVRND